MCCRTVAARGARRCEEQAGCVGAAPGRAPANMCGRAAWPAGVLGNGGRAGGSHRIAKCNTEGQERVTARNNISRQNTLVQKSSQRAPWPGPAQRRGRGVSDGGFPRGGAAWPDPRAGGLRHAIHAGGLRGAGGAGAGGLADALRRPRPRREGAPPPSPQLMPPSSAVFIFAWSW